MAETIMKYINLFGGVAFGGTSFVIGLTELYTDEPGSYVPLNYLLQTGEQVEIITGKQSGPSRDWLNPNLGYLNTSRARAKVQHWFKEQAREQNVQAGKLMVERELTRMALNGADYAQLIDRLGLKSQEDLFFCFNISKIS